MKEEQYIKAFSEIDKTVKKIIENPDIEDSEYKIFRDKIIQEIDVENAWSKFSLKKDRGYFIYSSVAAAVLLFLTLLIFIPSQNIKESETLISSDILPAEGTVTLRLSSGKVLEINSSETSEELNEGVVVSTDGNEISYEGVSQDKTNQYIDNDISNKLEYNELITPKGRSYSIVLSDGSRIWLNAQSSIKYPVRFDKNERKVEISGEAFFNVKHDSLRPFIVETLDYDVKVLGTKFNVKAYSDEENSSTTLVSGSVIIPLKSGGEKRLSPGEQLNFSRTEKSVKVEEVDVELYTSWVDNNLRIEQMPLGEIFKILKRRYEISVYFVEDKLMDEQFSGKIPLNDNLKIVLDQMSKVSNVEFEYQKNLVVVKYKNI